MNNNKKIITVANKEVELQNISETQAKKIEYTINSTLHNMGINQMLTSNDMNNYIMVSVNIANDLVDIQKKYNNLLDLYENLQQSNKETKNQLSLLKLELDKLNSDTFFEDSKYLDNIRTLRGDITENNELDSNLTDTETSELDKFITLKEISEGKNFDKKITYPDDIENAQIDITESKDLIPKEIKKKPRHKKR